jgi:ABC-type branched-subunit amino acid transport system ATPase component
MSTSLLQLTNVTIRFGGLTAVSSVTADVREGELADLNSQLKRLF